MKKPGAWCTGLEKVCLGGRKSDPLYRPKAYLRGT
jgi:hypothetical protein